MKDNAQLVEDLFEINRRICFDLWNLCSDNNTPYSLSPRLIFPKKRDGTIRISEKESKTLCCGLLNNSNYYYSVETPTEQLYGQGHRSALTDVSLYKLKNNQFEKVANIEFKAHKSNFDNIRKDIEKLVPFLKS